jgi:transposase InsO family protein
MEQEAEQSPQGKEFLPPEGGRKRRGKKKVPPYPFALKLKAVKLYLEEGYSGSLIAQELGATQQSLSGWVQVYRELGEEGLKHYSRHTLPGRAKLPAPVTQTILQLKRANPGFGIKRISQWLRRCFWMQASPETVRQKLHGAKLMESAPPQKQRNLTRPRFFERATPNQMWQSDIFTFRLGGKYAYLIGFLDDYSRFVTAADLFRSPTAQAVIEVYRVGVGEFKPPKEMLTDNGRQYTTWRGTSRFEAELRKDGVKHFKSRPHHPMTLGKIERFWSSIWQDFLVRAQFDSFENARERIKLWVQYYNHQRPHQGIGGLCPADRFFEIQSELRKTIESGIKENLLEMALRGQPRAPFYMVGRMDGQSVVLRAEKGKLKLELSNEQSTQELSYDLHPKDPTQTQPEPAAAGDRQSPGGAGGLDREVQTGGGLPPVGHQLDHLPPVAAAGDGRHASSPGEPGEPEGRRSFEPEASGVTGPQTTSPEHLPPPGQTGAGPEQACVRSAESLLIKAHEGPFVDGPQGPGARAADPASAGGHDHCQPGGQAVGHLPQDLLPVGTTGLERDARCGDPTAAGPPAQAHQPHRTQAGTESVDPPETDRQSRGEQRDPRDPGHCSPPPAGAGR